MRIRRVVTGFDANGEGVVTTDDTVADDIAGPDDSRIGLIWAYHDQVTFREPNALEPMPTGRIDSGQLRMKWGTAELGPGRKMPMHATKTVDLVTMLEGEVTLVLDSGKEVVLKAHDTLLQRGVLHAWENRSDRPAKWAVVTLGRLDAS